MKHPDLVIKPSPIIASLCYSIFRIEPYTSCSFGCVYCYGKWYLSEKTPRPVEKHIKLFNRVAKRIKKYNLHPYPFRLSTLVDPFQEAERIHKISYLALSVALKREYPIIVNTKSPLISEDPWITVLKELSAKNLLVVQLSSASPFKIKELEPKAPSFTELLGLAKNLSKEKVPVVFRYQPLIPGLSDIPEVIEDAFKELKNANIKHIIVEYLRTNIDLLNLFKKHALDKTPYTLRWDAYSTDSKIVKPPLSYRKEKLLEIKSITHEVGVKIATCKEPILIDNTLDCCGFYLFSKYLKRPTLREKDIRSVEAIAYPPSSINLEKYPKIIRKTLKWYNRVLNKIIENSQLEVLDFR